MLAGVIVSNLTNRVHDFLIRFGQKPNSSLDMKSRLYHDIGIYGDMALFLLEQLQDEGINMQEFNFDDYFPREFIGSNILSNFYYLIFPAQRHKYFSERNFKEFTLQMLDRLLIKRVWTDQNP
jgi:hypothetical protein